MDKTDVSLFRKDRLDQILRSNGIYDSEILSVCGYKKDSGFLDSPNVKQLEDMQKFFETKYPLVNFNYIVNRSSSPNKLLNLGTVRILMKTKNIGINQINSYIKEELGEDNAFYKILNGLYPVNEDQANEIMHYLNDLVDNTGNFNYAAASTEDDKEEVVEEVSVKKETTGNKKWKTDPDNFRENKIDLKTLIQLCRSHGYTKQGFHDMVYPGTSTYNTVSKLLDGTLASIPMEMVSGIEAALDTDIFYLEGTHKVQNGSKSKNHYFPVNNEKNFKFTKEFLNSTDIAIFKVMAKNAGIDYKLFTRARDGENIFFVETCIKRMFTKALLETIHVEDINDILFSADYSRIESKRFISAGRNAKLIDMPEKKAKKEKKVSVTEDVDTSKDTTTVDNDQYTDQDIDQICNEAEELESTTKEDLSLENDSIVEINNKPYVEKDKIKIPEPEPEKEEEKTTPEPEKKEEKKEYRDDIYRSNSLQSNTYMAIQKAAHKFSNKYTCECGFYFSPIPSDFICPKCKTPVNTPISIKVDPDNIDVSDNKEKDITLKDVIEFINKCNCSSEQLNKLSRLCLAVAEKNRILESLEY